MNQTLDRANAASWLSQHLLSPLSSPFFVVKLFYDYGFWILQLVTYFSTWCSGLKSPRSPLATEHSTWGGYAQRRWVCFLAWTSIATRSYFPFYAPRQLMMTSDQSMCTVLCRVLPQRSLLFCLFRGLRPRQKYSFPSPSVNTGGTCSFWPKFFRNTLFMK